MQPSGPMSPRESGRATPLERGRARRAAGGHFTADEKRRIFRAMVVGELEAGFLRYSRRQALIQYAGKLGISEFDANLLIAEAQYHRNEIEPAGFLTPATLETISQPGRWSLSMRIALAIVIALFIDLLLIRFVIH